MLRAKIKINLKQNFTFFSVKVLGHSHFENCFEQFDLALYIRLRVYKWAK